MQKVIEEVFEKHLSRYHYEKSTAPKISQTLVTVIKDRVKTLGFKRYKIVKRYKITTTTDQLVTTIKRLTAKEAIINTLQRSQQHPPTPDHKASQQLITKPQCENVNLHKINRPTHRRKNPIQPTSTNTTRTTAPTTNKSPHHGRL